MSHADPDLLRFLETRSIACPTCGYDLKGVRELTCPECGGAITRGALSHPDLRPGGWRRDAFLVGLAFVLLITLLAFLPIASLASTASAWKGIVLGALALGLLALKARLLFLAIWRARALWDRRGTISRSILLASTLIGAMVVVWVL